MYPERVRACWDKKEGGMTGGALQTALCLSWLLPVTDCSLLQWGARGWASRAVSFSHCQPRPGQKKWAHLFQQEMISSSRIQWGEQPQRAKHNIQHGGRGNTPWNNSVLLQSMSRLGGVGRSEPTVLHRQKNVVAGQMPYSALYGKNRPYQKFPAIL